MSHSSGIILDAFYWFNLNPSYKSQPILKWYLNLRPKEERETDANELEL